MSGETDLSKLLRGMSARLSPETFVFATVADRLPPKGAAPVMVFQEAEGATLILTRAEADAAELPYAFACRMITLEVHSALEAVGFMARIAAALSAAGVSCNPVSGYYHDHLFVPLDRAEDAMRVLSELSS